MGDSVGVQLPVTEIYLGLANHPVQLSLAIPLWAGRMSTGDGLLADTREETASSVTESSITGLLAYWPSRLRAGC